VGSISRRRPRQLRVMVERMDKMLTPEQMDKLLKYKTDSSKTTLEDTISKKKRRREAETSSQVTAPDTRVTTIPLSSNLTDSEAKTAIQNGQLQDNIRRYYFEPSY